MTAPDTLPPELAELGELLREDPPRPDPAWARELDDRAAAGFPRPPRRSPWAALKGRRRALAPAVAFACVAVLVAGLAAVDLADEGPGPQGGGMASRGAGEADSPAPDVAAPGADSSVRGGAEPSLAAPAPGPGVAGDPSDGRERRSRERSAALTLAARPSRIEEVAAGILRVTDAAGGFVATSTVAGGDASGGSFELRIPTARLDKAVADLSRLAAVRERSQTSRDITAETVSARERLREAEGERRGLLRALARAETLDETEAVKARLREVNRRIAVHRSSLRRVRNRAAFANVSVALVAEQGGTAVPLDDGRWTPADALRDAVRVLELAAAIGLVVLALLVPVGLLAGLGAVAARALGRRRREQALDSA